ncbi:MAG: DUF3618 domain-containing protein [Solirubrobacteraceae bacterium]
MSAAAGAGQPRTPEEIQAEIEQTRAELGDTVGVLAGKADVKAQARDRIAQVRDSAQHKKDELASRAREVAPDSAGAGAQQLATTVQRKPLPFAAAGAFAAGVLVGRILRRR